MSATRCSSTSLSKSTRIARIAIGAFALLALTGPALSAEASSKDEILTLTTAIQVPNSALSVFDISWADPVMKKYFLADRNNKAIDIVDTTNNSITQSDAVFGGVGPPPASNPPAGPNGVWTVNHQEIWAGDGNRAVQVLDAKGKYITTQFPDQQAESMRGASIRAINWSSQRVTKKRPGRGLTSSRPAGRTVTRWWERSSLTV
jgi:hypothetical protein